MFSRNYFDECMSLYFLIYRKPSFQIKSPDIKIIISLIFSIQMSQEERDEIGSQRKVLCFLLQHITRRVLGIENIEEIINTAKDVSKGTDLANEMETYVIKLLRTLLDGSSDARTTFLKICGLQILLTIFKISLQFFKFNASYSQLF